MDWNSSRQRCQDLGGDLVILNSQEEQVWTLLCKLWLFTLALNPVHPSDQHVVHNYKSFWKIKRFLTDLCDLIKYIIQYNCIWVTEKLQLASIYPWLLMRLIQHFYFNVTINHYCVFVITAIHDWDPMWILVKRWGRNMLLVIFKKNFMWKIMKTTSVGREEKVV